MAKKKVPWGQYLFVLLVIFALSTTTTLSRYMTTVAGTGTATVARPVVDIIQVDETGTSTEVPENTPLTTVETTTNTEATYYFTVKNTKDNIRNEVTMDYSIRPKVVVPDGSTAPNMSFRLFRPTPPPTTEAPFSASTPLTEIPDIPEGSTTETADGVYQDAAMFLGFETDETQYYVLKVTSGTAGSFQIDIDVVAE